MLISWIRKDYTFRKQHGQDLNSSISDSNNPTGSKGNIHNQITLPDMVKLKVVPPRAQITQFTARSGDSSYHTQLHPLCCTRFLFSTTIKILGQLNFLPKGTYIKRQPID